MVVETTTKDILDLLTAGITISGVDLDIRDLTSASDSIEVIQDTFADCKVEVHTADGTVLPTGIYGWDGSLWETLNTDTSNRLLVAATGTFWQDTQPVSGTFWQDTQPVSATDLDIRDLTSVSDSVEAIQTSTKTFNTYSFMEWLMENGTLITKKAGAANGIATVYTVPANKVFYLVSATIAWRNSATTGATNCAMYIDDHDHPIFWPLVSGVDDDHEIISTSFPIPLKLTTGQVIKVQSTQDNQSASGVIAGYEVSA